MHDTTPIGPSDPFAVSPPPTDGDVYVPVWASLTVKPACNFGVQLLASYDVVPGQAVEDRVTIAAGLMFQPSNACAEAPWLRVH